MPASILVATPEHLCEAGLAIAAVRAGEIGLLDLGWGVGAEARRAAVEHLARHVGDAPTWGLRWNTWGSPDRMPCYLEGLVDSPVPRLLLAGLDGDEAHLARALAEARRLATAVLVEAYDVAQAEAAARLGYDGVVLVGNEAGGRVGDASAFLLLQAVRDRLRLPWWVKGAWGPDTAAAAHVAGARGVALGEELWLARESPFDDAMRRRLAAFDGSETSTLGGDDAPVRLSRHVDRDGVEALLRAQAAGAQWPAALRARWRERPPSKGGPLPLGQGIALAAALATRHVTVGGILEAFRAGVEHAQTQAPRQRAFAPGAPLATAHGTRFPIVQGPMTRVSDTPAFARAVADHGALPFLALALLRGPEATALLTATRDRLGDLPWGVGVLGFVPPELREEQLAAVRAVKPSFAIIAGGRPSQAAALEQDGIATYLHVPSPGLLRTFLADGARRFVLEGRECGGHVGPRSSFVLWQSAIDVLLAAEKVDLSQVHVLFAGGIHDALSAAMVQALAVPLVERGVRIGVLMGTAYLFTPEAVETGAIGLAFQDEALACHRTTLLESGVGHATRCAQTPFAEEFRSTRRRLLAEGRPPEEVRVQLELLNVGRLRIAAKGVTRPVRPTPLVPLQAAPPLEHVPEADQRREGLYMIGQLATLRDGRLSMAALHDGVSRGSVEMLQRHGARPLPWQDARGAPRAGQAIAIVGMASIFPDAPDLRTYWGNVLEGVDSVRDVPAERWDAEAFFDADRKAPDRLYARRGGFLAAQRFDPVRYRIPPATIGHIEPAQLLALEVARRALDDAGLLTRPFDRERTSVIFGSSGIHDLGIAYAMRTMLPQLVDQATDLDPAERTRFVETLRRVLPEWSEDSFSGFLPNVITGRITNRLDLRGPNFVVDAACAASLAAIHTAVEQLRSGTCDIALAGAVDCSNNAFTFMGFAKTQALTTGDHPRPFDAGADGIVLGEGVGAVVLKRLDDAERDGDDIYAVIRGIGCSSDGMNRSLTAPHAEGQVLAIRRAYADAGVDPRTVELIEAHATGTTVGDAAEIDALRAVYGPGPTSCALGSVKSQIGHAKTAAGIAGLIKAALAVEHGVLPPTIHVEQPNPRITADDCPFYVNSRARPWIPSRPSLPRRAGVSAFGFGGTNFHLVLESWDRGYHEASARDLAPRGSEVFAWQRRDRPEVLDAVRRLRQGLARIEEPSLAALAAAVHNDESAWKGKGRDGVRLAIVAGDVEDLREKLERAEGWLAGKEDHFDALGVYLSEGKGADPSQVAFLFPGQGAQRVDMLADLVRARPFSTRLWSDADRLLETFLPRRLSTLVYPPPAFTKDAAKAQVETLKDTRIAQPAVGTVDLFALDVLQTFGLRPAFAAGHSYGEYVALAAAGVYSRDDLLVLSAKRGLAVHAVAANGTGGMAAVAADATAVEAALAELGIDARVANLNAPRQTIIGGSREAIEKALARLPAKGLAVRRVAVSAAFHTPAVQAASETLVDELDRIEVRPPAFPVYSNVTAAPYPSDVPAIKDILNRHLAHPVRFVEQIRAMHDAGARIFVEAGPGRILTGLVKRILEGRDHVALALDHATQDAWSTLGHLLAHTFAMGLPVDLAPLFAGRRLTTQGVGAFLAEQEANQALRPTDWWVDPAGNRPAARPAARPASRSTSPGADAPVAIEAVRPDPVPMPTPPAPPPDDPAARIQDAVGQWIELQREQQRLNERFLALQERLLAASTGTATASPAPTTAPPGPAAPPSPAGLSVAPAPLLPAELTGAPPPRPDPSPQASADDGAAPPVATFQADLLAEVSRRTGYPEDMLELDLPLEAGLGIDSIKVMEIFSALKAYHPYLADPHDDDEEVLARFTQLRTLRAILDHYAEKRHARPTAAGTPPRVTDVATARPPGDVERRVLRSVPSADAGEVDLTRPDLLGLPEGAGIVVVGEVPELAGVLRAALAASGRPVWHVVHGTSSEPTGAHADRLEVDLDDPSAVARLASRLRDEGRATVGGWVNLLNLDPAYRETDLARLDDPLRLSRRLLHLAQALEPDLTDGGLVVNLTALDGRFGLGARGPLAVAQAASLGFFKALAKEWPQARVKNVDVDPSAEPSVLLTGLAGELAASDGPVEVGFDTSGRWRLDLEEVAHARPANGSPADGASLALPLGPDSVVLVTGGADGITAEILKDVAAASRAHLVIVGRSPRPRREDEPAALRDVAGEQDLREALVAQARAANGSRLPAAIETEVRRILKSRRIHENLAAFEALGSKVEYHALDVRDAEALADLIDDIYARHGRIDGVIHGAGVIEDKRIRDKTADSFDRVFQTKVTPALVFARKLRPEGLAFLVFFSSVSGRFGNAGQADYSAANEVLNKLAAHLDRAWPGRAVAINWGPWDAGMLSEPLRRAYAQRGIGLISPAAGRRAFLEEVACGAPQAAEVVLACTVERLAGDAPGDGR